jgi:hypothetical protein
MINHSKTRTELLRLIKGLPDSEIIVAKRFVEFLITNIQDPLLLALAMAPLDDEPLTPEEREAIQEAREDIKAGRVKPWEVVKKEMGL